jgi:hypothetical protein
MKSKTNIKVDGKEVSAATLIWLSDLSITTMKKDGKIIVDTLQIKISK